MTRLLVEIPKSKDVAFILELLERLEAKVLRKEEILTVEEPEEFYKRFNLNLSDYKFDREEANDR